MKVPVFHQLLEVKAPGDLLEMPVLGLLRGPDVSRKEEAPGVNSVLIP